MKRLFFINGTMGVGKTATGTALLRLLPKCVFLDGDWCWNMHPFVVNDETKAMVEENICYLLANFLKCSAYENVVFCWVMHEEDILHRILSRLSLENVGLYKFSLVCTEQTLLERLSKDIDNGFRTEGVIPRSLSRLGLYVSMDTIKIDVTNLDLKQAAAEILAHVWN